jgi:phage repressor protein C with HTH and peptisase S24 domain
VEKNLADRLRARSAQLHLNAQQLATRAGVNRSFVYDILRRRSVSPAADKLAKVAEVLKVDTGWLLTGEGHVAGETPWGGEEAGFVAIRSVKAVASMGGGRAVEDQIEHGEPYHFRRAWVCEVLNAAPDDLRVIRVEGDSMEPTLLDGDIILIDLMRRAPTPPGLFVLFDGIGVVAKRLEHIPNSDPPTLRILSDNARYGTYERTAEEVNIVGRVRWLGREL